MERTRPFLGLLGQTETFHVRLNQTKFGDEALATLVERYGGKIWGLDLRNTPVTDLGLRHLEGLSHLEQYSWQ